MIGALGTGVAFLVAAGAAQGGRSSGRSQSRAGSILAIHAVCATLWCVISARTGLVGPVPIVLFWGGALLAWLGIRLHVESSILLSMLDVVFRSPGIERSEVLSRLAAEHGARGRVDALVRGGFLRERNGALELRAKGRFVARVVSLLSSRAP